jgi:alcohol dehydrogenase (cytochrome c)
VFVADMAGDVYALNDATGDTLWQTRSPGAVGGGIVSYSTSSGDQRIAVASGMVSPIWSTPKVNASVIVYGLGISQQ